MKTFFTAFVLMFSAIYHVQACSCAFLYDNFCQSITNPNGDVWVDHHIYHVKVLTQEGTGIKVRILKTYYGEQLDGEEIFISSGSGFDCRVGTEIFEVGKEHIFAAWKDNGSYALSICGITYLSVEDGMVTGNVAPCIQEVPLSEFGSLEDCGFDASPTPDKPAKQAALKLQPVLASQEIILTAQDWTDNGDLELTIFDVSGKIVYNRKDLQFDTNNSLAIDVRTWAAGLYFIRAGYQNRQETIRFVKVRVG